MFTSNSASTAAAFKKAISNNALSHAHIFVSKSPGVLDECAQKISRVLLCTGNKSASCTCSSCSYSDLALHPDVITLGSFQEHTKVKISMLRDILPSLHIRPKLGNYKLVIMPSVSNLSISVGNALLKILEEPPAHLVFLLFSPQVATVLPTILSRCQSWYISSSPLNIKEVSNVFFSELGLKSKTDTITDPLHLLQQICEIIKGLSSPYMIAEDWKKYELMSLLNLIYVTASQALQFKFRAKYDSKPEYDNFECIAALDASILFRQIDSITANIKRIKLGYTLNEMLVLEKLLASYQG